MADDRLMDLCRSILALGEAQTKEQAALRKVQLERVGRETRRGGQGRHEHDHHAQRSQA